MTAQRIRITVFHRDELGGVRGPNGENWVVFVRDQEHPLRSWWSWCYTETEAEELAERLRRKEQTAARG